MKSAETPAGAGLIDKMRTARYDDIMQEPQPKRQAMLAGAKKRLVIELDPQEHGAIKAQALRLGISMKEYVLRQSCATVGRTRSRMI